MKNVKKDVKSKGEVVDQVTVPIFETLDEAVKHGGGGDAGKAAVLESYNKTVSDGITNAARAAKVKPASSTARLNRLAKKDPKVKAKIEAMLKEFEAEAG